MTDASFEKWLSGDDVFVDFGEKVRRGYDPEIVDRHLEYLSAGIRALRREVDSADRVDDESLQVMMRAGRRSVEDALEEARLKADGMIAEAESESARLIGEAHAEANQIRATGEEEARQQEETIEIRRIEIEALDEEIEVRQKALRAAAAELLQLADGIADGIPDRPEIDIRESDSDEAADDEVPTSDTTS